MKTIVVSNFVHNLPPTQKGDAPINFDNGREMWKVRALVYGRALIPNDAEEEEDEPMDRPAEVVVSCPHYVDWTPKGRGHPYFATEAEARAVAASL